MSILEQVPRSIKPKNIWLLGAGKFGQLALKRIKRNLPDVEITLVDKLQQSAVPQGVIVVYEDAITWLVENLPRDGGPDMVIPAIPLHMVAEWLKEKIADSHSVLAVTIGKDLLKILPLPIQNGDNQVYISHADFLCPDNCPEPKLLCSHTGKERGEEMFRLLGNLRSDGYLSHVVRSYQLFPGVGGIYPADMWNLLDGVRKSPGKPLFIATACRCHGVMDGLCFRAK